VPGRHRSAPTRVTSIAEDARSEVILTGSSADPLAGGAWRPADVELDQAEMARCRTSSLRQRRRRGRIEPLPTCRAGRSGRVRRFPAVAPMGTSGRQAEAKLVVSGLHPGLAVMLNRFLRRLQRERVPMHYRLVTTSVVERLWIMLSATRSTRSTADLRDRGREPTP
jgi:hypothetical protein